MQLKFQLGGQRVFALQQSAQNWNKSKLNQYFQNASVLQQSQQKMRDVDFRQRK
jgi:hypothetical protein